MKAIFGGAVYLIPLVVGLTTSTKKSNNKENKIESKVKHPLRKQQIIIFARRTQF